MGSLEDATCDETLPAFQRAYAWYRLFRHWASLRFNDTAGLAPGSLELWARGVFGLLRQTKTSGPDKKITILPVFVAFDAWVRKPLWLRTGLGVWKSDALSYERDYFLPLPAPDLNSTCKKRALYSDAVGFSRSLFRTLQVPGGGELLLYPDAAAFWTEHSDRAGVDSWLAALLVPADLRRFLGRWAAQSSEDAYVRTSVRICENLQRFAALHARAQASGGPDFFGEEHLQKQLEGFLENLGIEEVEIQAQLGRITLADGELDPTPVASLSAAGFLSIAQAPAQSSAGSGDTVLVANPNEVTALAVDEEEQDDENEDEEEEAIPHGELQDDVDVAGYALDEQEEEEEARPAPKGYIASISKRGRFRRLHYAGFCWRVPGLHYLEWEDLGDTDPDLSRIDARCSDCFPASKPEARAAEKALAEDDADSLSSSSTSSNEG